MIIDKNTVIKPQINLVTRKLSYFLLGLTVFLFVLAGFLKVNAAAGIYSVINFQGKLVNKADGTNITDGNYNFTFKLYDAASGGNLLPSGTGWSETQNLSVTSGIFRAGLGSSTAFPATLDFNSDSIYLDVSFNGETFSTRVRLTAVPYAFNAQKVGGLTVTNTTGTLTVTGGSTVAFGGNFTTSGSNAVTLSSTGTTGLTLPTSGTLTTGTGIANYLSRWSSTGNLSTGVSYDNGTSVGIGYTNVNSAGQFVVSGNVGIGTTIPTNKLDVIGAVSIGYNGSTAAPSNGLIVNGNVGIASTGFTGATLDVAGTLRIGTTNAAANAQTLCLGTNNIVSACTGGGGSITGTGVGNYLARWTSSTNISTGISYDNGTSLGVGYTNPNASAALAVNGNVGIGTTIPRDALDINGSAAVGSLPGAVLPQANMLYVSGNVGIGTTAPTKVLEINAGSQAMSSAQMLLTGSALEVSFSISNTGTSGHNWALMSASTGSGVISAGGFGIYDFGAGASRMTFDTGGNVGINTGAGTLAEKLVIKGSANSSTNEDMLDLLNGVAGGGWNVGAYRGIIWRGNEGGSDIKSRISSEPSATGKWNLDFWTTADGGTNVLRRIRIGADGNIGIGTTTPANKLDVNGGLAVGTYAGVSTAPSNGFIVSGNVGIGSTGYTGATLDVSGTLRIGTTNAAANSQTLCLGTNNIISACTSGGTFTGAGLSNYLVRWSSATNLSTGISYDNGTSVGIGYTNVNSAGMLVVSGNIGIGLTNPTNKLDVLGAVSIGFNGNTAAPSNGLMVFGNVGIGSTGYTGATLDVSGTLRIGTTNAAANAQTLCLGTNNIVSACNGGGGSITGTGIGNYLARWTSATNLSTGVVYDNGTSVGIGFTNPSPNTMLAVNGNVGIGLTSNQSRLSVRGVGTTTNWTFHLEDANGNDNLIVLDNGNVGIGTTSPDGRMQLNGNTTVGATATNYGLKITAGLNGTMGTTFPQTAYYSFYNVPLIGVTAAAGTAPQLRNLFVTYLGASVATGQTVTNSYSLFVAGLNGNPASVVNNYAFVTNTGSGNVGIGTSVPNGLFVVGLGTSQSIYADVAGNVNIGSTAAGINYSINIGIGSSTPTIKIGTGNTASHVIFADITGIAAAAAGSAAWSNGEFHFGTSAAVAAGGRIWIKSGNSVYTFRSAARGALADYSEYMKQEIPSESEPGDIMTMSQSGTGKVTRSSIQYDPNVAGAVTTGERGTSNNDLEFDNFSETGSHQGNPEWANVGMLGQVYVKVNLENGKINAGDAVTTSSQAGVGMKATEAGRIVGWAVQPWDGTQVRDERAPQQPLPAGVGMILVYVNPTLYTPKMEKPDTLVFDPQGIVNTLTFDLPVIGYRIRDSVGNVIKTTASFAESAIGNLRAGGIQAKQTVTESLQAKEAQIDLAKIDFVEAQTVTTDLLKTKGLVITGDDGLDKIVFDNQGNAFFAGTVTADTIKAKHIDGLEMIEDKLATLEGQIAGISTNSTDVNVASMSGTLNDTAKRVDSLEKRLGDLEKISYQPTASQTAFLQVASSSANLNNLGTSIPMSFDSAVITNNLTVLGKTNLNSLGVTGDIGAGVLVMNGLDLNGGANIYTLSGALKIQASALGDIELMNDLVHLDTKGNVRLKSGDVVLEKGKIQGNDSFTGSATVPHGETKVIITKSWDEAPVSIIATPTYNARTWISDVSKSGFTINVDSSSSLDQPIYWVAFFGVVPTPTPLTTSKLP